ncbi:hypothetical protein Tco_0097859, partial [Tanacetum coccineum]
YEVAEESDTCTRGQDSAAVIALDPRLLDGKGLAGNECCELVDLGNNENTLQANGL